MIVVTDAGPLIYLAGAGLGACVGADEVAAAAWLEVVDEPPDPVLLLEMEPGEAAAIPLAQRIGAVLLCDDGAARVHARLHGVLVVGTLGVLLQAKRDGHVLLVDPIISRMRDLGMYVSESLVDQVLRAAGER